MGRRKKVEGITLDLTEDVSCDINALIEAEEQKLVPKAVVVLKEIDAKLTVEELHTMVQSLKHSCNDCETVIYYQPRKWSSLNLCYSCHKARFISLEKELGEYLTEKGHISCNFCGKIRSDPYDFHFDHINMYSKTGSVGPMLFTGCNIDKIKAEIDKCQLLCVSCHAVVTHMELRYGFIKTKHRRNKTTRKYKESIYDEYMGEVYAFMRGLHGK
jgi:hypothetical protein